MKSNYGRVQGFQRDRQNLLFIIKMVFGGQKAKSLEKRFSHPPKLLILMIHFAAPAELYRMLLSSSSLHGAAASTSPGANSEREYEFKSV